MTNEQMELGLAGGRNCRTTARRQGRVSRGRWWFEQMRRVVDGAMDWQPAPSPRPEQVWLPNAQRQIRI
jgi:hypothetical protein